MTTMNLASTTRVALPARRNVRAAQSVRPMRSLTVVRAEKDLGDKAQDAAQNVKETVQEKAGQAKGAVEDAGETIKQKASGAADTLQGKADQAQGEADKAGSKAKGKAEEVKGDVKRNL